MNRKDQIDNMDEKQLVHQNQKAIATLEAIWKSVEERLCARAGDDRICANAIASAEAGSIYHDLVSLHRRMDAFAAKVKVGARVSIFIG